MVTREGDELLATLLPEVGLPTFAGRLGERLSLLDQGRPVPLGEAGELRVERDGEPLLGGKPSQAATRLYQFEPNRPACAELRAELERRGLLDRARDLLPRGIWDALTP